VKCVNRNVLNKPRISDRSNIHVLSTPVFTYINSRESVIVIRMSDKINCPTSQSVT